MRVLKQLCFLLVVFFGQQQTLFAQNRPFKHAMILSGGGMDMYPFLGFYDSAVNAGKQPDLLISACGGSIAAAIIKAYPDTILRNEFVRSKEFHQFLKEIKYVDSSMWGPLMEIASLHFGDEHQLKTSTRKRKGTKYIKVPSKRIIPDPFSFSLLSADNNFASLSENENFESSEGPEVIMVAAKMLYNENQVGEEILAGEKLYQETYFTSERVRPYLEGRKSPVGSQFGSFIEEEVKVLTGVSLNSAARASISDAGLIPPGLVNGEQYLTGAININPIDLASDLAAEVTTTYPDKWNISFEVQNLRKYFAFEPIETRLETVRSEKVTHWIDKSATDYSKLMVRIENNLTWNSWSSFGYQPTNNVPADYQEFLEKIEAQYSFGLARGAEAFQAKNGSKDHIREPFHTGEE